jgi:hypothetical protein
LPARPAQAAARVFGVEIIEEGGKGQRSKQQALIVQRFKHCQHQRCIAEADIRP